MTARRSTPASGTTRSLGELRTTLEMTVQKLRNENVNSDDLAKLGAFLQGCERRALECGDADLAHQFKELRSNVIVQLVRLDLSLMAPTGSGAAGQGQTR